MHKSKLYFAKPTLCSAMGYCTKIQTSMSIHSGDMHLQIWQFLRFVRFWTFSLEMCAESKIEKPSFHSHSLHFLNRNIPQWQEKQVVWSNFNFEVVFWTCAFFTVHAEHDFRPQTSIYQQVSKIFTLYGHIIYQKNCNFARNSNNYKPKALLLNH